MNQSGRLRWGILGTGNIARQFAGDLAETERSELSAVGSRRPESAGRFADSHQAGFHGSYDDVIGRSDVDAVYVSLPNALHCDWTIKALQSGKHVLCEKPIAADQAQAEEMFDAAEKAGRLLVEAFMYRSHPQTNAVQQAVADGEIGELRLIRTSFCFRVRNTAGNIRFDRELAGGALMDVGSYCVNFSRLLAQSEPEVVHATARLHDSGVDEVTCADLKFPGGIVASFSCGLGTQADNTAYVSGTDGYIEVPLPWKPPRKGAAHTIATQTPPLVDGGAPTGSQLRSRVYSVDASLALYAAEAADFAAAVLDGRAPVVSREDSIGNMRVLDELRRQAGVI